MQKVHCNVAIREVNNWIFTFPDSSISLALLLCCTGSTGFAWGVWVLGDWLQQVTDPVRDVAQLDLLSCGAGEEEGSYYTSRIIVIKDIQSHPSSGFHLAFSCCAFLPS